MAVEAGRIGFRPMVRDDLPMLSRWLQEPGVVRWFGSGDYAAELAEQLLDDRIRQRIVLLDGRPIAYVQDYDIQAFDDHPLGFLPPGSRGIDTFIGAAGDMGRGLGSSYLRALVAEGAAAGVPAFGIDPHPDNAGAIRAYGKVGFRPHETRMTEWGPVLLMSLMVQPRDFAST